MSKSDKKSTGKKIAATVGVAVLVLLLAVLLLNALLSVFMDGYYPTFGKYRLFAVVTDSMDPEIPEGHMIVDKVPSSADDIKVGSVITFRVKSEGSSYVLTHRVTFINNNGKEPIYTTRGDNAKGEDKYKPSYSDVIGVYTGKHCGFFGYFFGFIQSTQGAITLLLVLFVVITAWLFVFYIGMHEKKRKMETAALKKSEGALSSVNLRYDNICEITAVIDVLGMITSEPKTRIEAKNIEARLNDFINAQSIELPQTPETAAILDSLPAPDTPESLVSALKSGATLRQAEDGQTLVLTGISGGKSFLLTPVQTPDGIVLCQQGVRIRSELAPNVEEIGETSMPQFPEFFVGQPLEKTIIYPELPQPSGATFGPAELNGSESYFSKPMDQKQLEAALSSPAPSGSAQIVALDSAQKALSPAVSKEIAPVAQDAENASRRAYAQYRELSAQLELRQAEELSTLLSEVAPLTPEERARIAEYRAAQTPKKPKAKKQTTPEERAAKKAAAEKRKQEQQAFIDALSPADRELYFTEQKLSRSRAAAIRRLKRINSDRRLLDKLDN